MTKPPKFIRINPEEWGFEGELSDKLNNSEGQVWVSELQETLKNCTEHQLLFNMRNRVYRLPSPFSSTDLCIKAFRKPELLRSAYYRRYGSKAHRAHRYARHLFEQGAAVAEPIGYLEQWQGNQQVQSYLISRFVENSTDLYSEMNYLLRERPYASDFIRLLRTAASAVRTMHDSGFLHGDLGPQNILMTRVDDAEWSDITFIDLNRGRLIPNPTLKERAKDLDRMKIPTHFRQIFYQIYFNDSEIPKEFRKWAEHYEQRFYLHQRSRKYRHPLRTLKNWLKPEQKERKEVSTGQPAPRDVWLWDEYSGQPSVVLKGRDRRRQRNPGDFLPTLHSCIKKSAAFFRSYKALKSSAYNEARPMRHGLGVSIEVDESFSQQRQALLAIPNTSLLVRCYYHLGETHIQACTKAIEELKSDGHSVSLALIQNREAVNDPEKWAQFASKILELTHTFLDCIEIGHAVNRVKWGLWNLEEINRLWLHAATWRARYPNLTFIGPAVNDFEFQYYPPLLERAGTAFDALSGHLYVDRRGAPEAGQNGFSTLEKALLARAIANTYGKQGYYITEVNWPLQNTGLHSPLAGAYIQRGAKESPLHVTETESAAYMIRYALIALCSGAANRIWWWRLAHPGFGLIDNNNGWRERPGWVALVQFNTALKDETFRGREEKDGAIWWHFDRCSLVYALKPVQVNPGDSISHITDMTGKPFNQEKGNSILVDGNPVYLFHR